jgi:hypothetical protein
MRYFKRENHIFYKIDDETRTVTELFDIPTQRRIMKTRVESAYQSLLKQIEEAKVIEITEVDFYDKLSQLIDFLTDL